MKYSQLSALYDLGTVLEKVSNDPKMSTSKIFPEFKLVFIIQGEVGGGSRKLWTFSTYCDFFV